VVDDVFAFNDANDPVESKEFPRWRSAAPNERPTMPEKKEVEGSRSAGAGDSGLLLLLVMVVQANET
jgi:hypothetical protein